MNHVVRFYGGVYHGEIRYVDEYEDSLIIAEAPPFTTYPDTKYADMFRIRRHKYGRLEILLGDSENPFSVFVYEGWY